MLTKVHREEEFAGISFLCYLGKNHGDISPRVWSPGAWWRKIMSSSSIMKFKSALLLTLTWLLNSCEFETLKNEGPL